MHPASGTSPLGHLYSIFEGLQILRFSEIYLSQVGSLCILTN